MSWGLAVVSSGYLVSRVLEQLPEQWSLRGLVSRTAWTVRVKCQRPRGMDGMDGTRYPVPVRVKCWRPRGMDGTGEVLAGIRGRQ